MKIGNEDARQKAGGIPKVIHRAFGSVQQGSAPPPTALNCITRRRGRQMSVSSKRKENAVTFKLRDRDGQLLGHTEENNAVLHGRGPAFGRGMRKKKDQAVMAEKANSRADEQMHAK